MEETHSRGEVKVTRNLMAEKVQAEINKQEGYLLKINSDMNFLREQKDRVNCVLNVLKNNIVGKGKTDDKKDTN